MTHAIDSHLHLLDRRRAYPWLTDELDPLDRPWPLAELEAEFNRNAVAAGIAVQAVGDMQETRDLLATAATTSRIAGVIGWVDLTDPDVGRLISSLRAGAGGTKLVGVRHQVHDEPDPYWLSRAEVIAGLRHVAAAGLTFDLLIRSREIDAAITAIRAVPELVTVLDHCGKPPVKTGDTTAWRTGIARLASEPRVYCKLSGLVTEADWTGWSPSQLCPYLQTALQAFSPERCMFGSDWPVCRLAAPYDQVIALVGDALQGLGAGAHDAVWRTTALRAYPRLQLPRLALPDTTDEGSAHA